MTLERVAVHQTRLRTPGVGLDGRGIALGARGLVLLSSIERLVAFLALATSQRSLADLVPSISIDVVRSKLAAREVTFSFAAESSDRMDRVAELARLAGGYTFTGTSRHFVQYRDASAPFGFDAAELLADDAELVLYHASFSQTYARERTIPLASLLLRLSPRAAPEAEAPVSPAAPSGAAAARSGPRWIVAERGLGGALVHYLVRSRIDAEVGLAEWPPASALEEEPVQRYVFRVPELPARVARLARGTPGLALFDPAAPGAAVESGWRHPIALGACPVFDPAGMVFFRGAGRAPLELAKLPALGDVRAFARVEVRAEPIASERASGEGRPATVRVPLRLLPTIEPWRAVTATWIAPSDLPLLRRLAYALPSSTLRRARLALTELGALVVDPHGVESIPLGAFHRELGERLYVPAGHAPVPAVAPEVLRRSLGDTAGKLVFFGLDGRALAIEERAFVPLETAVLEAGSWTAVPAVAIEAALATELPTIALEPLGLRPMRDVAAPEDDVETA